MVLQNTGPENGALRTSHAERESVVERIQQAFADGQLDKVEFDHRLHLAMTAKTRSELAVVTADLPYAGSHPSASHRCASPDGAERLLAAMAHAAGAMTSFIGPLIMLCCVDRRYPFVRRHIRAALNFQLVLLIFTIVTFGLGGIVYAVAWIVALVAGIVALTGQPFRYPWTPRLIR